jgi:hypothetical protein
VRVSTCLPLSLPCFRGGHTVATAVVVTLFHSAVAAVIAVANKSTAAVIVHATAFTFLAAATFAVAYNALATAAAAAAAGKSIMFTLSPVRTGGVWGSGE